MQVCDIIWSCLRLLNSIIQTKVLRNSILYSVTLGKTPSVFGDFKFGKKHMNCET